VKHFTDCSRSSQGFADRAQDFWDRMADRSGLINTLLSQGLASFRPSPKGQADDTKLDAIIAYSFKRISRSTQHTGYLNERLVDR
jgi:hypothetical protein